MKNVQFGNNLKKLRLEKKLSQKDLGSIFNLAESTIGMYERNERRPDYELLISFADFFHVSVDFLIRQHVHTDGITKFIITLSQANEYKIYEVKKYWDFLENYHNNQ